ncbi:MAG: hypothetical protein MK193_05985 [Lentisphaeria bacterium]|nr:hypothetical protein [Lentisphaeria bacterium]
MYKQGQKFKCPHCNNESIIKIRSVMDGWIKVGEAAFCALCDHKLEEDANAKPEIPEQDRKKASAKLAQLLNVQDVTKTEVLNISGELQFCRDCVSFAENPFKSMCDLHKKEVTPMDDCPSFQRKKISKNASETEKRRDQ